MTFSRACSRSTKRASSLCACSIAALTAILICGASVFTACTGTSDNPTIPNHQGMEESLIGLWYEEFDSTGILEDTGEAFTSVVLAMQVNEDHTGCLYAGAFNAGDYDNPIVVYGGPEEAGFTWWLTSSGQLIMTATDGG